MQDIESVGEISAPKPQEWISVKDRLPDTNQDVIICNVFLSGGYEWLMNGYIDKMGKFRDYETFEVRHPTHWMPIPEPPKQST